MTEKNIIIFDDFAVFSSYPKEITLSMLRQSIHLLVTYDKPFPVCSDERILIVIKEIAPPICSISISLPVEINEAIDMLEEATDLLENNEANFFCPDESF